MDNENELNELNELNPPVMDGYTKIPTFKLWVANRFPYMETDFDALTNYELLTALVDYLNNVIKNEETVESNVSKLNQAYLELFNYVKDYFNNLDVQEEINNKLDDLVEDGTLTRLIGAYVQPLIDDQNQEISNFKTSVNNQIAQQNAQIQSVASGSPLVASNVAGMTDTSRTYVNTTDGNWYYYNGSAWTIGGVYQATAIADGSIIPEMTNFILKNESVNKWKPADQNFNNVNISYDYESFYTRINGNISATGRTLLQKEYLESGTWSIKAFNYSGNKPAIYIYDEETYNNQNWSSPIATLSAGSYAININVENSGMVYFVAYFSVDKNPFDYEAQIMLSKNTFTQVTTFVPITYRLGTFIDIPHTNYWNNKKILFYGDSLTAWSTAPSLIANYFNLVSTNKGIAGSTAAFIDGGTEVQTTNSGSSDTRLATLSNNNDIVVLMFGTNDYLQNVPLGIVPNTFNIDDTFDNTTFAGAILKILHYLYTNNPNARIIMMCPPWNHFQYINSKSLRDYGNIIKEIGRLTITPVIDLMEELNANAINYSNFYSDTGTHFNDDGYERVAELIRNKIENFTPLV